jgi:serine/threonine protein kinase
VGKLSHRNVFIKKFVATTSADNSKMKKIKSNFNRTPDNYLKLQSLFMREVRVLSDCSHPNIIPIIGERMLL